MTIDYITISAWIITPLLYFTKLWVSMDRAEQDIYLRWIGVRK